MISAGSFRSFRSYMCISCVPLLSFVCCMTIYRMYGSKICVIWTTAQWLWARKFGRCFCCCWCSFVYRFGAKNLRTIFFIMLWMKRTIVTSRMYNWWWWWCEGDKFEKLDANLLWVSFRIHDPYVREGTSKLIRVMLSISYQIVWILSWMLDKLLSKLDNGYRTKLRAKYIHIAVIRLHTVYDIIRKLPNIPHEYYTLCFSVRLSFFCDVFHISCYIISILLF